MPHGTEFSADKRLLARNLDYVLRENNAKVVGILSELPKEGKTTFLHAVAPELRRIYGKKVVIVDCQTTPQQPASREGVDYLSLNRLAPDQSLSELERLAAIKTVVTEVAPDYDVVLLDLSVPHRTATMVLPDVKIDGVVMVRTSIGIDNGTHDVSDLLRDKNIPVLGVVLNEGVV